jgi:hypothetical protein
MLCWFLAVSVLSLGSAMALGFAAPLFTTRRGTDPERDKKFKSGFLQRRGGQNRWLGNACGAGTMPHGAPTVHLGIKHFQAPLQTWAGNVLATSLSQSGLGNVLAR